MRPDENKITRLASELAQSVYETLGESCNVQKVLREIEKIDQYNLPSRISVIESKLIGYDKFGQKMDALSKQLARLEGRLISERNRKRSGHLSSRQ